jgi:CorA-like Mg2+ transporter protein
MERQNYIPKTWDLPQSIRIRLGESVGKQRLMDEEGHLLLLLHAPPKAEDDEVRSAVVFWNNPAGEWKSSPIGGGLSGLEAHLASYRTMIHRLDEEVETAKTARQYFDVMRHMHPMQRATRSMLEVMQAARDARPNETRLISLRDQSADLERAIELVAADAKAGMDFSLAETATQQAISADMSNREARRLNRLAAFFFPLVTLVSIFGMNEPTQVYSSSGFWVILLSGIVLGFIVHALIAASHKKP